MYNKKKNIVMLLLVVVLTLCAIPTSAAAVKTGRFNQNGWNRYTVVYATKKQNTSIKICTFDKLGWRSSGLFDLQVVVPEYGYQWNKCRSGSSLNLRKWFPTATKFYVRIKPHNYSSSSWWVGANSFLNIGKCYYWSLDVRNGHF